MSKQRVKFGDYYIGDHSWISFDYTGQVVSRTFPRLIGSKIYSTSEMGGGMVQITVHGWVIKNTREELEDYFRNLPDNLGYVAKALTYDTKTIDNCVFQSLKHSTSYEKWADFSIVFITGAQNL